MDWKKKIAAVVFLLALVCVPVAAFLLPDQAVSKTERRKLAKKPAFTVAAFWDGTYMEQLETYFSEQFPVRDGLRTVKAETETALLGKADTNGYFKVEDGIYHLEAELNEKNVGRVADSIEKLCTEQFQNADCYVAVIPDKNYYLADKQYPILDYARLDEMIQAEIPSAQKINLYDKLHLKDYYRTDLHWKQEKITGVVDALVQSMGQQTNTISDGWQIATEDFVGAYEAASALKTTPDTIFYRTDLSIERMQVYDYERKQNVSVYAPEKIGGMDDYDFYLWGARALLTIQNPECHNGKKLLLFRDSFGSSIAPLLAEYYEEVTLVDLRYVSASHALELLGDTEYQDVLFLYSAPILNHGDSLRFG
ncbi:putative uncharacterized protein [Roseburia inulinivorans CAG:15]|jgi:hypothetical protein|nr:putative uncharacterized protein [Roseburia inulinivorans CAG:15]